MSVKIAGITKYTNLREALKDVLKNLNNIHAQMCGNISKGRK